MDKLKIFFQTKPVFLYLLPVFFVLHGYTDHYALVPVKDALVLNVKYLAISLLLSLLFWLLYKNFHKANLVAFCIMAYNFFFGSTHDMLKVGFNNTFIIKYSFIIPVSGIIFLLLIIYIKKSKNKFSNIAKYLNALFLLLILLDAGILIFKFTKKEIPGVIAFPGTLIACDSCKKPDIYLIIADEYAGKKELENIFSYDNTDFETALINRSFHVINNTKSNYNRTLYSMASLLNMNYIETLKSNHVNNTDMYQCTDLIKINNLAFFLKENNYKIYNLSPFDFKDNPKPVEVIFFPDRKALITSQTFTNRFWKNLWFHFSSQRKIEKIINQNLYNNLKIDSLTKHIVVKKEGLPKFTYSHLTMPHYSYYFDSTGKKNIIEKLFDDNKLNKKDYISYLIYTNKKLLELVDYIKEKSEHPPVIMLMSDHGFRQFEENEKVDNKYHFMNLNAVFIPNGNYQGFYDGMSNVNQFRVLLNSQFGQKLPLLKDSTSFLSE